MPTLELSGGSRFAGHGGVRRPEGGTCLVLPKIGNAQKCFRIDSQIDKRFELPLELHGFFASAVSS